MALINLAVSVCAKLRPGRMQTTGENNKKKYVDICYMILLLSSLTKQLGKFHYCVIVLS